MYDSSWKSIRGRIYNELPTCWTISYIYCAWNNDTRQGIPIQSRKGEQADYRGLTCESSVNQRNFERCSGVTVNASKGKGLHTESLTYAPRKSQKRSISSIVLAENLSGSQNAGGRLRFNPFNTILVAWKNVRGYKETNIEYSFYSYRIFCML